jgi:exodeoxyribonuclease VII large subunit
MQSELRERLRAFSGLFAGLAGDHVTRARLDASGAVRQLSAGVVRHHERRRKELEGAAGKLNALSPLATLERGYSIVRTETGKTVRSARTLHPGDAVDLVFRDGVTGATVNRVDSSATLAPPDESSTSSAP